MYFSRLEINPQRRQAKFFAANPRALHAAVEMAFPQAVREQDSRNLWRLDRGEHSQVLYVVSEARPDLRHIQEQAGWDTAPPESTDYDRLLGALRTGQRYVFRLAANPVKRQFVAGSRGKILPHVTESQQIQWLVERSHGWGFQIPVVDSAGQREALVAEPAPDVRVVQRHDHSFSKQGRCMVTQRHVVFAGSLEVSDAAVFRQALVTGMGRGKAYGLGLMTLAR